MKVFIGRFSFQSFMKIGCYRGELIQFLILLTPLSLKLNQLPLVFIFTEGIFFIFCQNKDMANFHFLQGKLEHLN